MPKLDLTDRFIATIKTKKIVDYFDAKTRGLAIRIAPTGVKSWSVMFTVPGTEKRARLSLGTYPATSLARARMRAIEARGHVEQGVDPRTLRAPATMVADSGPVTIAMLAKIYLVKHAAKIKTGRELERRLRGDVLPIIGSVKLAELHRRDAHRVLDRIIERGAASSAKKTFADLRAMVRWAVARGDLDHDPLAGLKPPTTSKSRERFLDVEEIAALWPAWPNVFPAAMTLALKLALSTGQRIGEVCGMTLEELDLAKAVWNLPPERTKNGSAHSVPLNDMALDLIAEARPTAINGRLFQLNTQRLGNLLNQRRDRLPVRDWSAHDLRRTVCTHLAEMGVSPLIIGACVNHRSLTKSGVTLGTYVRYDYAKEKRRALELWADRLSAIVTGGAANVLALQRAR
jgi:integrase